MLTFRVMDKSTIHELWPIARYYFLKVAARSKVVALPEDVYGAAYTDTCSVLILSWEDKVVGAAALRQTTGDDERPELYVWALGTEPKLPIPFFHAFSAELLRKAKEMGAPTVSMASNRAGWGRFIKQFGWGPSYTTYKIEVPNG